MSSPASADIACKGLRWCLALLDGLVAGGLDTFVLSPGSRSTPVVTAAQRHDRITPIPILDERSAAFFALGCARASGRPVALLATSGSAPAHWYPAVIEAHELGIPLVLLSADRPATLRGWGANQTIDQTRLFGRFVREQHDPGLPDDSPAGLKSVRALGLRAACKALGPNAGPIHINLPFDEPLVAGPQCRPADLPPLIAPAPVRDIRLDLDGWPEGRGLVVCGPGTLDSGLAPAVTALVRHKSIPVLADPLSGLRIGPAASAVITCYDALLRNPEAAERLRPDWILRLGRTPVSKRLGEWWAGVPAILCASGGGWIDPSHDVVQRITAPAAALLHALVECRVPAADPGWLGLWRTAEARVSEIARAYLDGSEWFEGHLIQALLDRIPDGEALLCANSLPIRQMDTWSGSRQQTRCIRLFGNRGVSGIDGQASTLAGLNHGGNPCWGLLGDLSLFHDVGGLLLANRLDRPLLVLNNGGGRIFDYLPQHALPEVESLWRTPVDLDIRAVASTFGLLHQLVGDDSQLAQALGKARVSGGARTLIEVRLDADHSRALHLAYWQRVATARIW